MSEDKTLDGRLKYSWDGLGKLTAIEEVNGTKKWQFIYDEQGRRIQKTGPSGTIRFHYDGDSNRLMVETDTAGKSIREYVYNADHSLVGLKTNGTWYNYQRNYCGDVVAITDLAGNVAVKYTYDTWGKPLTTNVFDLELTDQPIRYASYYYDEDLALYYLMARYYHPEQAVFLSIDPELDADESVSMANGYSYADNNPVLKIDPDGTWAWAVIGAGFGAYSGYKRAKAKGYTGWRKWGTIAGSAAIGSVGSFKAAGYATRFVTSRVSIITRKPNLLIGAYGKTGKRKGFPYLVIHKHDVASQIVHRVKNKNIKGPVKRWHYHLMGKAHSKIPYVTIRGVKGYKWRK